MVAQNVRVRWREEREERRGERGERGERGVEREERRERGEETTRGKEKRGEERRGEERRGGACLKELIKKARLYRITVMSWGYGW